MKRSRRIAARVDSYALYAFQADASPYETLYAHGRWWKRVRRAIDDERDYAIFDGTLYEPMESLS